MLCVVWRVGVMWRVVLSVVFQQRSGAARLTLMEEVDRWLHEGEVRARVREVESSCAWLCASNTCACPCQSKSSSHHLTGSSGTATTVVKQVGRRVRGMLFSVRACVRLDRVKFLLRVGMVMHLARTAGR